MVFYRCKCGDSWSSSSMGVPRCRSCSKCGSDLATGPDGHREPEPHEWRPRFNESTGAREADICLKCLRRRKDEPAPEAPAGAP